MSHRLHNLRMENDAAGFAMDELRPRFLRLAGRHENGTAPRAISVYQLFQTPVVISERLAALLELKPGARVLEPSAGLGRLLDALLLFSPSEVVAIDSAPDCAGELFRQNRAGVRILQRDFLSVNPGETGAFDAVIMNPPFHMRSDIRHVQHALKFLKPGGRLVSLLLDTDRRRDAFKNQAQQWIELPAETFKETGTQVKTVIAVIQT